MTWSSNKTTKCWYFQYNFAGWWYENSRIALRTQILLVDNPKQTDEDNNQNQNYPPIQPSTLSTGLLDVKLAMIACIMRRPVALSTSLEALIWCRRGRRRRHCVLGKIVLITIVILASTLSSRYHLLSDGFVLVPVVSATSGFTSPRSRWSAGFDQSPDVLNPDRPSSPTNITEERFEYTAEVVGSRGRIGSFFLVYGSQPPEGDHINYNPSKSTTITTSSTIACPRGLSPGCLTSSGRPIFVATPGNVWNEIINKTVPNRRRDLVLVGNGIPPPTYDNSGNPIDFTVVVPHFGILETCQRLIPFSSSSSSSGTDAASLLSPIVTKPGSPPTYVYGPHSEAVKKIFHNHGVKVDAVSSMAEIRARAAQKLLWASCLWLLCHNNEDGPSTIGKAHQQQRGNLGRLVNELLPIMNSKIRSTFSITTAIPGANSQQITSSREEIDEYMESYSMSIADAIPNRDLAVSEFIDRNGYWLQDLTTIDEIQKQQPFHLELLRQHLSDDEIVQACNNINEDNNGEDDKAGSIVEATTTDLNMTFWGHRRTRETSNGLKEQKCPNVVIVGGGMIGSSVAFSLARKKPDWNITLIEKMDKTENGRTTKASWAWINAQNKQPKSYQNLNQLGVQAWKRHSILKDHVSWVGSLVRFTEIPPFVADGSYPAEGPLTSDQISELEPLAEWNINEDSSKNGYTFFFPDEGCVDPFDVISDLRESARQMGVHIESNCKVTNVVRDVESGRVCAVECCATGDDENIVDNPGSSGQNTATMFLLADLVIVAAGCGSKATFLGGLPLVDRPGTIEYARNEDTHSKVSSSSTELNLRRILVDPARHSHVLQRSNGDIVIGGGEGALEFGGKNNRENEKNLPEGPSRDDADDDMDYSSSSSSSSFLLDLANQLVPKLLQQAKVVERHEAVRPMPQDGLPIVGYVATVSGLYTVVTHSGITLGPILADLAACEVSEDLDLEILDLYRPDRFFRG